MNYTHRFLLLAAGLLFFLPGQAQQNTVAPLTVDKIMQHPRWIGISPYNIAWSADSKNVFFRWNPASEADDATYITDLAGNQPKKADATQLKVYAAATSGTFSKNRTQKVFSRHGDILLLDVATQQIRQITNTVDTETAPVFSGDETKVIFQRGTNLYSIHLKTAELVQLTDFRTGVAPAELSKSEYEKWLEKDQLAHFQVLAERKQARQRAKDRNSKEAPDRPYTIYIQDKTLDQLVISPDGKYVTYRLTKTAKAKNTIVPSYVTESSFTEDLQARPNVGSEQSTFEFGIYDLVRDTAFVIGYHAVPGIYDLPGYYKDYKRTEDGKNKKIRDVIVHGSYWSADSKNAVVILRALDSKDRWIMQLVPATGELKLLDRQRDEAWIGGPGIDNWLWSAGNAGWLPDNKRFWFQSEASGYSHLYTVNVENGQKKAVTQGNYEIRAAQVSADGKYWYFSSSEVHPGEGHFYKMPIDGGKAVKLTAMTGENEVSLSPDEKTIAIRYSYSNKPWELYLMENREGATPKRVTNSLTEEFKSYPWRDPEIVTFKAADGATVYGRLYRPANATGQTPAVIFVHGAGYLQNAHKRWSQYFREYMFHNLLADNGYTVLDIDYRGSAGYGRDWRTGIYRHMGGKDLSDHIDGAKFLVEKYNVDPKRMGIYGGSYGGFITLMAMFTQPDVFAAGAALRSVTDWAHYNHDYTSNILNVPVLDSAAYAKSSPIYYAEGLKGALLICHGMIDTNVHFQDVVRLSQRLIELKKENWELAVYPLEDHGFVEPSSWADEYKRIFKLFETNLKK